MKRKIEDSDSNVDESSEEFTEARRPTKRTVFYTVNAIILPTVASIYVLWSTSTSGKRKKIRTYGKSNKELNALIIRKFKSL